MTPDVAAGHVQRRGRRGRADAGREGEVAAAVRGDRDEVAGHGLRPGRDAAAAGDLERARDAGRHESGQAVAGPRVEQAGRRERHERRPGRSADEVAGDVDDDVGLRPAGAGPHRRDGPGSVERHGEARGAGVADRDIDDRRSRERRGERSQAEIAGARLTGHGHRSAHRDRVGRHAAAPGEGERPGRAARERAAQTQARPRVEDARRREAAEPGANGLGRGGRDAGRVGRPGRLDERLGGAARRDPDVALEARDRAPLGDRHRDLVPREPVGAHRPRRDREERPRADGRDERRGGVGRGPDIQRRGDDRPEPAGHQQRRLRVRARDVPRRDVAVDVAGPDAERGAVAGRAAVRQARRGRVGRPVEPRPAVDRDLDVVVGDPALVAADPRDPERLRRLGRRQRPDAGERRRVVVEELLGDRLAHLGPGAVVAERPDPAPRGGRRG